MVLTPCKGSWDPRQGSCDCDWAASGLRLLDEAQSKLEVCTAHEQCVEEAHEHCKETRHTDRRDLWLISWHLPCDWVANIMITVSSSHFRWGGLVGVGCENSELGRKRRSAAREDARNVGVVPWSMDQGCLAQGKEDIMRCGHTSQNVALDVM